MISLVVEDAERAIKLFWLSGTFEASSDVLYSRESMIGAENDIKPIMAYVGRKWRVGPKGLRFRIMSLEIISC